MWPEPSGGDPLSHHPPEGAGTDGSVDRHLRVLILAGGIGSRFWPASTPSRPKQLLPLGSERPLVADAVERALPLCGPEGIRILAGESLQAPLREVLPELPHRSFRVEPMARGTAPVLAWAAWEALREDPDMVLVSLHSDHVIHPPQALRALLRGAVEVARSTGLLLTVAVSPDRPETGYGYLLPGDPVPDVPGGVPTRRVSRFEEKPDAATAARYLEEGYRWNSGIFIWRADRFLEELRLHSPEVAPHLPLLEAGEVTAFFEAVPTIAVDHAVLERSPHVAFVEAQFRWDDVGSWEALQRTRPLDERGNVAAGSAHLVDCRDTVVWGEDGPVVAWGVEGMVVVRAMGVTFVCPRGRARELKSLLGQLPEELVDPR